MTLSLIYRITKSLFGTELKTCCKCSRNAHYELEARPGTYHCSIHAYEYERDNPLPGQKMPTGPDAISKIHELQRLKDSLL